MEPKNEIFAIDFAQLAREIAMDIFPVADVIKLHNLTDEEWLRIQENPKFQEMLQQMVVEWNSSGSTKDRIRIKASTGLEAMLEPLILELSNKDIPYNQRIEGAKFLSKVGEVDPQQHITPGGSGGGGGVTININTGHGRLPLIIDATPNPPVPAITEP